jgi:uncharacterized membrane protein YraQ (UPF0718 family)
VTGLSPLARSLAPLAEALTLSLRESALLIADVLPWILAGALAGAAMRVVRKVPFMETLVRLPARAAVPLASLSGAASPLCTIGSVPIVTGLVSSGFPKAAAAAFLASSSMVTPQMFLMTAGFLGPRLALLQAAGGILAGTLAGAFLSLSRGQEGRLFRDLPPAPAGVPPTAKGFLRHLTDQLEYGLFWFVVGVIVSQFAAALVDAGVIPFSGSGLPRWPVTEGAIAGGAASTPPQNRGMGAGSAAILGALVACPAYSCGGAALPFLALLRSLGIDDAFFLAFLVAGPATRVRSAAALAKILKPAALASYLAFVVAFSILWAIAVGRL